MGKSSPHSNQSLRVVHASMVCVTNPHLFLHGPVLGEDTARKCNEDHVFNRFGSLDGFQREPL